MFLCNYTYCFDQYSVLRGLLDNKSYEPHIQIEKNRKKEKEYVLYFHGLGSSVNENFFKKDKRRLGIICDLPYSAVFKKDRKISFGGVYDILAALVILDVLRTKYAISKLHIEGQSLGGSLCFTLLYTLQNDSFLKKECEELHIDKNLLRNMIITVYIDRPMISLVSSLQFHNNIMRPFIQKFSQGQQKDIINLAQEFQGNDGDFFMAVLNKLGYNSKIIDYSKIIKSMTGIVCDMHYVSPKQAIKEINREHTKELPILIHAAKKDDVVGYEEQRYLYDMLFEQSKKYKPEFYLSDLNHAQENEKLFEVIDAFRTKYEQSRGDDYMLEEALSKLTASLKNILLSM